MRPVAEGECLALWPFWLKHPVMLGTAMQCAPLEIGQHSFAFACTQARARAAAHTQPTCSCYGNHSPYKFRKIAPPPKDT